MSEASVVLKRDEVLEVWSKAADDYGRDDEARASKRHRRGGVGERKGHYRNYDGLGGCGSHQLRRQNSLRWVAFSIAMNCGEAEIFCSDCAVFLLVDAYGLEG